MKLITWQNELKAIFTTSQELFEYLQIPMKEQTPYAHASFPLRIPKSFAARMKKGDLHDPLLLQVLPRPEEKISASTQGFSLDPLQESEFRYAPGVLQKFQGRVLIVSTGYCPVHCRYCFRRHMDYAEQQLSLKDWEITLATLRNDPSITEVIFSGGDPLTLPDRKLHDLIHDLHTIPHIRSIRLHSRFPIVIPTRLTNELKEILQSSKGKKARILTVLHINHAQELDDALSSTLRAWADDGIVWLNQSVLLRGVNDTLAAQVQLWQRCFESGVMAYYLHQFDRVVGAGHFEVPITEGQRLMAELRKSLPGYMAPLYVQEVPFAGTKVPLESYVDKFLT